MSKKASPADVQAAANEGLRPLNLGGKLRAVEHEHNKRRNGREVTR